MGHGVPVPDLRGPTARRMLADEERAHASTARLLAAACNSLNEARAERDAARMTVANLSDQMDGLLRENAGIPFLMDMIAEAEEVAHGRAVLAEEE
jgi:hypothetical protein